MTGVRTRLTVYTTKTFKTFKRFHEKNLFGLERRRLLTPKRNIKKLIYGPITELFVDTRIEGLSFDQGMIESVKPFMVSATNKLLSPRELGEAIGVSESSLKRWADDGLLRVTRTAGGHRRIPLAEAIRFIRESRSSLVRPEVLGLRDLNAVAGRIPAMDDQSSVLYDHLESGRSAQTRGLVLSMYLSGLSVAEICDGPLFSALKRLGELWQETGRGVFIEHRATDICIQALNQLRLLLESPSDAPISVGGAPDKEVSILPSIAAATVLKSTGMTAVNLGAQTPVDALIQAAEEYNARLIWVSVTHASNADSILRYLNTLAEASTSMGTSIIIGGRMVEHLKLSAPRAIHVGRSMSELAAFARGLLVAPESAQEE